MYKVAVLVISDKVYTGEMQDESGKTLLQCMEKGSLSVVHYAILPKELPFITRELMRLCDENLADLVLTIGGTGLAKRDITPEATQEVVEKLCNGIPEALRAYSLNSSKEAMLSRAMAGIRGETLIVNLPGSPGAMVECVEYCLQEVIKGLKMLKGSSGNTLYP